MKKIYTRKMDNLHIWLWILKDFSWMAGWKIFGTFMIIPTILVSLMLCFLTLNYRTRFLPNVAVLCWLLANSVWMIDEFFTLNINPLAVVFFVLGLIIMGCFYIFVRKKPRPAIS